VDLSPPSLGETPRKWRAAAGARVRHWRLAPPVTTRAGKHVHTRYDITPRRMANSWLATQAEGGSCAACTAHSRHIRGGARMKAGDACVVLQVPAA
jgi:hypothetical protein